MSLTAFVLWARAWRRAEGALRDRRFGLAEDQVAAMNVWTAFIAVGGLADGLILMTVLDWLSALAP